MSQRGNRSITRITATGDITEEKCYVYGIFLAAGSDVATATVYNADSATGSPVDELTAIANSPDGHYYGDEGVYFNTGLHIVLSGTAPSCTVIYKVVNG